VEVKLQTTELYLYWGLESSTAALRITYTSLNSLEKHIQKYNKGLKHMSEAGFMFLDMRSMYE
jgi:hypothetical protein